MTANPPSRSLRPRGLLTGAAWVASLSGLAAGAAYLWVFAIGDATMQGPWNSPWRALPVGPGQAVFIPAMLLLLAALITLRSLTRPKPGGRLLWAAVWTGFLTVLSSFYSWYFEATESVGGTSSYLWLLAIATTIITLAFLATGLIQVAVQRSRRTRTDVTHGSPRRR